MSFAKSSIHTFGTRFVLMALTMAAGIINARWLGPEGVGVLVLLALVKQTAFRFGTADHVGDVADGVSGFNRYSCRHAVDSRQVLFTMERYPG
jgi:hypothetical protein